jgi:hypothetical protein
MRLARRVATGLALGALLGFLAALLRPRGVRTSGSAHLWAQPLAEVDRRTVADTVERPSRSVISDPATRPLTLPRTPSRGVAGAGH